MDTSRYVAPDGIEKMVLSVFIIGQDEREMRMKMMVGNRLLEPLPLSLAVCFARIPMGYSVYSRYFPQ